VRGAESGEPLRSAAAVSAGMRLDIEFADGRVGATSDGASRLRAPEPPRPRRRRSFDPGQGSLF
jgi:exodeoxyribonuclease VII large subunit